MNPPHADNMQQIGPFLVPRLAQHPPCCERTPSEMMSSSSEQRVAFISGASPAFGATCGTPSGVGLEPQSTSSVAVEKASSRMTPRRICRGSRPSLEMIISPSA